MEADSPIFFQTHCSTVLSGLGQIVSTNHPAPHSPSHLLPPQKYPGKKQAEYTVKPFQESRHHPPPQSKHWRISFGLGMTWQSLFLQALPIPKNNSLSTFLTWLWGERENVTTISTKPVVSPCPFPLTGMLDTRYDG